MTIATIDEDSVLKNAINQLFQQPLQTLEKLQDSFSTRPALPENIASKQESFVLLNTQEQNGNGDSIDLCHNVQDINLKDETVIQSFMYRETNKNVELAKVDNYFDEGSNALFNLNDLNLDTKTEIDSDCFKNVLESTTKEHVGDINDSFKVQIINTLQEGDPLPGEVDDNDVLSPLLVLTSTTTLPMTCKRVSTVNNLPEQEANDQVEAFTLDEDFDYDHVTLTPKFDEAVFSLLNDRNRFT